MRLCFHALALDSEHWRAAVVR